jgi:cytochrome b involved in lipid metabolism
MFMRKKLIFIVCCVSVFIILITLYAGINHGGTMSYSSFLQKEEVGVMGADSLSVVEKKVMPTQNNFENLSKKTGSIIIDNSNDTLITISAEQLSSHNTKSDCWVGYEGKVYDITTWLLKHPGGVKAILPYCGTATEFEEAFIKKHGRSKVKLFMKVALYMGDVSNMGKVLSSAKVPGAKQLNAVAVEESEDDED